jgi:uncharacterized integral membrane protein
MTGLSRAKMIVGIVVGVLGAIIVLQNLQRVDTMVLLWRITMPHIVVLAIVFGAGFVLGAVLSVMWYVRYWQRSSSPPRGTATGAPEA